EVTATAQLAFSIAYTSPETFEARIDEAGESTDPRDERSDFYSLAATFYAIGTGRIPFGAPTPALVMRQVLEEPVPPTGHDGVNRFLATAMAKDPAKRHASAQHVIDELAAIAGTGTGTGTGRTSLSVPASTAAPAALPSVVGDEPTRVDGGLAGAAQQPVGADAAPTIVDDGLADAGVAGPTGGPAEPGGPRSTDPSGPTGPASPRRLDRRLFIGGAVGALGAAGLGLVVRDQLGGQASEPSIEAQASTSTSVAAPTPTTAPTSTSIVEEAPDFQAIVEGASGEVVISSPYGRAEAATAALQDVVAAIGTDDLDVTIEYGEWLSPAQVADQLAIDGGPDMHIWSGGSRSLDAVDVAADVSDLWSGGLGEELGDVLQAMATTENGEQRIVPWNYYLWAVYYRRSLFRERDYVVPTTYEQLLDLAAQMEADGITPFAFANDGGWPAMGTFDQLNLRTNGHEFHLELLAGRQSWQDDRVRAVFDRFAELLPYHQAGANERAWPEAADGLIDRSSGMFVTGTFVRDVFPVDDADDLDFFVFPEIDAAVGTAVVETPVDGWVLAARSGDDAAARAVLYQLGTAEVQDRFRRSDPSAVMANPQVDRSLYDPLLAKVATVVSGATARTQFFDRDTDPDFAADVVGPALASFIEDPTDIETLLVDIDREAEVRFGS
ncbi:MAG: hypothetical protein AAFO29_10620, partial [Actinomycetota bacterium]